MRTLTHSPADVMRWLLVRLGLGTDHRLGGTWPVYVGGESEKPVNMITVYDTVGTDDGSVMVGGELQGHYGFMVRVRSEYHSLGWTKANAIRANLAENCYDLVVNVPAYRATPAGVYVVGNCANIGSVMALGLNVPNEKSWLFTVNGVVNLDQSS